MLGYLQCGQYLERHLFVSSCLNHFEGFGLHRDLAGSNGYTMGVGLITYVYHMGLAAGIKMSEFVHEISFTI